MKKTVLLVSATIFGIAGSYIPFLWGDTNIFGGWSIFTGMIGGIFGIWVGVMITRFLS
ncbi:MAG TPA: hypothetical protein VIM37_01100 [Candidatus Microsaccharimonas sp.]|jgi:hypothetical protein